MHWWLIAVQATFDIAPGGQLTLAEDQPPPRRSPQFRGPPATTSLRLDSDLLGLKPGTDVILDAFAHAPKGRPISLVPVTLRVAQLEKTLLVHGPRVYESRWLADLTVSSARPFQTQPIHYEWAFGGTDSSHPDPARHRIYARNPVGKGFTVAKGRLVDQPAHTIEYLDQPAIAGPAGFGPIASHWSPRRERAGTYDSLWERSKKPLLPDDYDEQFMFAASDDQRFASPLVGGEMVALTNMTPDGLMQFVLPRISLSCRTRVGGRCEEHGANLSTVFVAPEELKLSLTWQSSLRVPSRETDYLDVTTIAEQPSATTVRRR